MSARDGEKKTKSKTGARRPRGALGKVVRAGVGRRRVQTVVMTLTTLMAVSSSVLAAGLLVASRQPFERAFAAQQGAQLTAQFDGSKVTAAQLSATAHASGVTAAAGPFAAVSAQPRGGSNAGFLAGATLPPITVAGRADPGGRIDDLILTQGSWATQPGQIVLNAASFGRLNPGAQLDFPGVPGDPSFTVVGTAQSVGDGADAWVAPSQIASLTAAGSAPGYQMLYRFSSAATDAQVNADRAVIAAAVPAGALTDTQSYLTLEAAADRNVGTFVPFLAAFGVLGLLMSILIIGIVVSGSVGAATRRIGILKALGFTPAQVVRAYVGQALIPAVVGTALGVVVGNTLATPVLNQAVTVYGYGTPTIAPWIDIAVAAAALVLVGATALGPALRAGRLRTVEAIAVGRAPRTGRGRAARGLLGRLPLSRALSLGVGNPLARPGRSAVTAAAIAFGAAAVTFAVGLGISLNDVQNGLNRNLPGDVYVDTPVAPGGSPGAGVQRVSVGSGGQVLTPAEAAADARAAGAVIAAQPGTEAYFGISDIQLGVPGVAGATTVTGYQSDAAWGAYQMISGNWFTGPAQVVVPTSFLTGSGLAVGDETTLTNAGRSVRVRIVGEALDTHKQGNRMLTEEATLAALGLDPAPDRYAVELKPGTDLGSYIKSLNAALGGSKGTAGASGGFSPTILAMDTLIGLLTAMLAAVAGLGVLNTVVLDTRERVHDLGVYKALGMTPRQTIVMVLASVAAIGLPVGVLAVPIGIALHDYIVPIMGHAAGTNLPAADVAVYRAPEIVLLALGGLVIAAAGAILPAGWAARTRTATALRTE